MPNPSFIHLACALLLAGCAAAPFQAPVGRAGTMAPRDAVLAAADAAPRPVPGTFAMHVTATGRIGERVFLNSESDYRDQRNLTIAIEPRSAQQLAVRYGEAPDRFFRDKQIEVRGAARRQRIDFMDDRRRPTGLYYYQTHVTVVDPDQIRVVG